MGIVNVTPDSFSDGGAFLEPGPAVAHALQLLDEGADWLDVGGESTRPGAAPVSAEEEIARVVPVVREVLRQRPTAVVSVDTSKPEVAQRAIEVGAQVVNDVTGLTNPQMREVCARAAVTCVLMHMRGSPRTMQQDTRYVDLVGEVQDFLAAQVALALAAGVRADRILVDPGVGFGKALEANTTLIAETARIAALGYPVVVGASRKSFIGRLTGRSVARERVAGSIGAALAAARHGARVLRVHDVQATKEALTVYLRCVRGDE